MDPNVNKRTLELESTKLSQARKTMGLWISPDVNN